MHDHACLHHATLVATSFLRCRPHRVTPFLWPSPHRDRALHASPVATSSLSSMLPQPWPYTSSSFLPHFSSLSLFLSSLPSAVAPSLHTPPVSTFQSQPHVTPRRPTREHISSQPFLHHACRPYVTPWQQPPQTTHLRDHTSHVKPRFTTNRSHLHTPPLCRYMPLSVMRTFRPSSCSPPPSAMHARLHHAALVATSSLRCHPHRAAHLHATPHQVILRAPMHAPSRAPSSFITILRFTSICMHARHHAPLHATTMRFSSSLRPCPTSMTTPSLLHHLHTSPQPPCFCTALPINTTLLRCPARGYTAAPLMQPRDLSFTTTPPHTPHRTFSGSAFSAPSSSSELHSCHGTTSSTFPSRLVAASLGRKLNEFT